MEKRKIGSKIAVLTAAAMIILAGCGQNEDEKIYLDEVKAEDYVKLPGQGRAGAALGQAGDRGLLPGHHRLQGTDGRFPGKVREILREVGE